MRRVAVVVMALMTLSLVGCASRASFVYKPSGPVATGAKTLPLKVAVTNFEDERQNENTKTTVLYWIPLVPYSSLAYDRPDGANGFLCHYAYNFRPSEDYARAVGASRCQVLKCKVLKTEFSRPDARIVDARLDFFRGHNTY